MFDIPEAVSKVAGFFGKALDKFIPDAAEREQFSLDMAQLAYREIELSNSDRSSARQREMAVKDNTNATLAYAITGALLISTIYFNTFPPSPEVKPIVENAVMALRDGWLIVIAYYFGSSRGSAAKHEMIDRLTKN